GARSFGDVPRVRHGAEPSWPHPARRGGRDPAPTRLLPRRPGRVRGLRGRRRAQGADQRGAAVPVLSAGGHGLAGLLSTAVAPPAGGLRTALWWRERASSAPGRAGSRAQQRTGAADPQLRALARHVLALAAVERGALGQAREHARAGAAVAGAAGLTALRAQLQLTLAWIELDSGNTAASWEVLESAQQRLPAAERGRARCLRGLLRCQRGEHGAAVAELTAALQQLAENSDPRWVANALLGRGLAHLYRGELEAAEADFAVAERMFAAEGCAARAAGCRHNRGYVAFR